MKEIELLISPEGEWINRISLVDEPAIEQDFLAFSKTHQIFSADEEKRIIVGPVMIPEKRMYREDSNGSGFYVYFSEETVRLAAHRWLMEDRNRKFNLDHSTDTASVSVIESWLVDDPDMDKSKALGFTAIPKGTWFIAAKIEDDNVWAAVKSGQFHGFSIEGIFHFEDPVVAEAEEFLKEFENSCH